MLYRITPMRERGRMLQKWRQATLYSAPCRILLRDFLDSHGNRYMQRAEAIDETTGRNADNLLPLLDAKVIRMDPDYIIITGFERWPDELDDKSFSDFQQTWYAAAVSTISDNYRSDALFKAPR